MVALGEQVVAEATLPLDVMEPARVRASSFNDVMDSARCRSDSFGVLPPTRGRTQSFNLEPPPGLGLASHAAPPGLSLSHTPVPLKIAVTEQDNVSLSQRNIDLAEENARLRRQCMEHEGFRLARENAALRQQLAAMRTGPLNSPWANCSWKAPRKDSPVTTEPPSDEDNDIVVISESDDDAAVVESNFKADEQHIDVTHTTVLMRNVPKSFSRQDLLDLLDNQGYSGKYNFLYLPLNFGTGSSLGYAFVNLATADDAEDFLQHFQEFTAWGVADGQACQIEKTSDQQGLEANISRYRNSPIMHHLVPDQCKPVVLFNGRRVVFPAPTVAIKQPPRRLLAGKLAQKE